MVKKKRGRKILWFEILFVIVNTLIMIFFYENVLLTTILLSLIAIIGLVKWRSLRTLCLFILTGIGGTILEMVAIYSGVWKYAFTSFFDVPLWLFILWGSTGAVIYQIAKTLKERRLEIK